MTIFRPCIDIHNAKVKQIVGSSLSDSKETLVTNFESELPPSWYANLYKKDALLGGHVIMLGPGNEHAAKEALAAYPNALQVGGGIHLSNAIDFLEAGASHVIVTSWIFQDGRLDMDKVQAISDLVGKSRLVLDLSCKRDKDGWVVAIHQWQTRTSTEISKETLEELGKYCNEFLIHAADVEGKQGGMDLDLIAFLAENSPIPVTYAGGAQSVEDLELCKKISKSKVDLTIGSALDIFGGKGAKYSDCVQFNKKQTKID
ncbi:MAG: phosphoribosylformimino-5-aminoimidazole carboxamide ribotide isomerase [Fibrobacter sp.]|nr:phosphoribosylformimino-5-aminoimidazole carboxamide ribotide isomerase [Fibrobacter sp.]